jgi:hypothetical protein
MSSLVHFYPGASVRTRVPIRTPDGRVIPARTNGMIRGIDRLDRPQVEFGHNVDLRVIGPAVSCEERDLEVVG